MDKKALRKIWSILAITEARIQSTGEYPQRFALESEIMDAMKELGYYKRPKNKPPLLSDVGNLKLPFPGASWLTQLLDAMKIGAQAQREADIKHYEGG